MKDTYKESLNPSDIAEGGGFRTPSLEPDAQLGRVLFDANPQPLVLFELESRRIVAANAMAIRNYGHARHEFARLSLVNLVMPEEAARFAAALADIGPEPRQLGIWRHRRKDATVLEVEMTVRSISIEGRNVGFAVVRDVTGRRRAEALQRLAQKAVDSIAEGIVITDAEGSIISVNAGFARITGYEAEDAVGRNPRFLRSGLQSSGFYAGMWQALRERGQWRGEVVNRRKSGETYTELLSISAIRDADGEVANYVGVFADLSERLEQERELRDTRERLELALDAGAVGTWRWSIGDGATEWDDRMCALFGLPAGAYPRDHAGFVEHVHPDDRASFAEAIARCLNDRSPLRAEFRVASGAEERFLFARGKLTLDKRDAPCQMIGVAWDVSERHRREAEIRELNTNLDRRVQERTAELKAAMVELDAFAYSVAHDLRAPLRGLDGFSHLLLEDHAASLDAEGRDYLNRIRAASQHLARLTDDLLELSRITRAPMERVPIDLTACAQEIVAALREETPERAAEFLIEPGMAAHGDPLLLRVLLENLLGNAWKYTMKRSAARIEFGRIASAQDRHTYFVRDNGAGFDMRFVDKLFKPFQRLHHGSEFPGTGIGLASVARAVARHGGRAWAESTLDAGATFYFTLPEHSAAQPARDA